MTITIATSNVRGPADPGLRSWESRRDLLAQTLLSLDADVIGTQETTGAQRDELLERMPGYGFVGRDHDGDRVGEHTGILFRADRVELIETADFWLSDTPDIPGTGTWGNPTPRVVTWVRVRVDGAELVVASTHFPWPADDAGEAGRTLCAGALRDRLALLAPDGALVLVGDFNTVPESEAHEVLTASGLTDAAAAAPHEGPTGTFHGFTGAPEERIDWILVRGLEVLGTRTVDDHAAGTWPSDHFPVVARLAAG